MEFPAPDGLQEEKSVEIAFVERLEKATSSTTGVWK